MRYAFTDSSGTVLTIIVGTLNPEQQQQFLRDYAILFGATQIIEASEGTSIWIGGTYDAAQGFLPPPQPEVVEGTSQVIEETPAMIEESTPEPEVAPEPQI